MMEEEVLLLDLKVTEFITLLQLQVKNMMHLKLVIVSQTESPLNLLAKHTTEKSTLIVEII